MKIAIGGDNAAFPLKSTIVEPVRALGHEITDHDCYNETPVDFPDISREVCTAVTGGNADRATLVCGTGVGAAIPANKMPGICDADTRPAAGHSGPSALTIAPTVLLQVLRQACRQPQPRHAEGQRRPKAARRSHSGWSRRPAPCPAAKRQR